MPRPSPHRWGGRSALLAARAAAPCPRRTSPTWVGGRRAFDVKARAHAEQAAERFARFLAVGALKHPGRGHAHPLGPGCRWFGRRWRRLSKGHGSCRLASRVPLAGGRGRRRCGGVAASEGSALASALSPVWRPASLPGGQLACRRIRGLPSPSRPPSPCVPAAAEGACRGRRALLGPGWLWQSELGYLRGPSGSKQALCLARAPILWRRVAGSERTDLRPRHALAGPEARKALRPPPASAEPRPHPRTPTLHARTGARSCFRRPLQDEHAARPPAARRDRGTGQADAGALPAVASGAPGHASHMSVRSLHPPQVQGPPQARRRPRGGGLAVRRGTAAGRTPGSRAARDGPRADGIAATVSLPSCQLLSASASGSRDSRARPKGRQGTGARGTAGIGPKGGPTVPRGAVAWLGTVRAAAGPWGHRLGPESRQARGAQLARRPRMCSDR